jgi:hypothetical protein
LCYVLFSSFGWNLVQNTWIRPENTSRAIWSFPEFKVNPEKMKIVQGISIDRLFVQSIIRSIDIQLTQLWSIEMRSIDSQNTIKAIDRSSIDRHYIRSIDFVSSRRFIYFQIFVRSKSKVEFYGQNWMLNCSEYLTRINSCSPFVTPILYIYEN